MKKSNTQSAAVAAFSLLLALNLIIIWGHSILPPVASTTESGILTTFLMRILPIGDDFELVDMIIRKCAHFCEFSLLGALFLSLTYSVAEFDLKRTWSYTAIPVLGCLFTASTDEMIQIFSGRGNSVFDVMLDFSGSVTAIALTFVILLFMKRHRARKEYSPA